jgi:hypothetical protein
MRQASGAFGGTRPHLSRDDIPRLMCIGFPAANNNGIIRHHRFRIRSGFQLLDQGIRMGNPWVLAYVHDDACIWDWAVLMPDSLRRFSRTTARPGSKPGRPLKLWPKEIHRPGLIVARMDQAPRFDSPT